MVIEILTMFIGSWGTLRSLDSEYVLVYCLFSTPDLGSTGFNPRISHPICTNQDDVFATSEGRGDY